MDPRIKNILEYAIMAPSGDNCQPWLIKVDGLKIELFNDPEKDTSLYNIKQRASLIAHGAFLENLALAAPAFGLQADINLFPDPDNQDHIATIDLSHGETAKSDLFKAIPQRQTNREKYQPVKISDSQIERWQQLAELTGKNIWIEQQPEQINNLSKLLSLNDRLVFEVADLHAFVFEQIRWTDTEAKLTEDGLDIKTLGLNAVDKFSFRFLKNHRFVALLNKGGFSRIIQMKAKQLLKTSSAIAIITISGKEAVDYVQGGRLWQRFLLQLASEGLTAQPIAGLACLMQATHEGLLDQKLTLKQRQQLLSSRQDLIKSMDDNNSSIILTMFRIGQGQQVTRALRRPLETFIC